MRRFFLVFFVSLAAALLAYPAACGSDQSTKPSHPSGVPAVNLFFNDKLLARLKNRIEHDARVHDAWKARLQQARAWTDLKLEIPRTGGGYYHDYTCPDDGARLLFDPHRPHEHLCPTCKRCLRGPHLDACWVATVHTSNVQTARILALNDRLFTKTADAQWAKDILLYYARHYSEYPVQGNRAGQGRIFFQSLDESVNLLEAAAVYELLAYNRLSPEEAQTLREQLFRPAAELVGRFRLGIHNIQCWHATFLLAAGLICDDEKLRDSALGSIEDNLVKGITPDGWWYEGSPGYHFYTLRALTRFALIAKNNDLRLPHTLRMIEMLLAPFRVAYPDLGLPTINDSSPANLAGLAPYLEAGTDLFDDRRLAPALARLYESTKTERTSFEAICYGPDKLPKSSALEQKSERFDRTGMTILRRPRTSLYALLRSGRFEGGHDHPDRLNLILYGLGQQLAPDLGTCGYGVPLLGWYKSTVAHNTLVLDEKSQDPHQSDAACVFFQDEPDFAAAAVRVTRVYPDAEMTRTIVALDDALIDYCRVRSAKDHTIDWVYHNTGQLVGDLAPATLATAIPRYEYLEDVRVGQVGNLSSSVGQVGNLSSKVAATSSSHSTAETGSQPVLQWQVKGGRVVVTLLDMNRAELFTARGPGFPGGEKMSLAIVRRRGSAADFVSVIQIVADGKRPLPAALIEHTGERVIVRVGEGPAAPPYELTPADAHRLTPSK